MDIIRSNPEVLQLNKNDEVSPTEKQKLIAQLKSALTKCSKERLREGSSLLKVLNQHLSELSAEVQKMSALVKKYQSEIEKKFKTRISKLTDSVIDPSRLAQEVTILIDKSDINEEITRLKEHISSLKALMNKKDISIGKKLDFYTQELLREVNTIGSKSSKSELTNRVVNAKSIVERVREQVQNVE